MPDTHKGRCLCGAVSFETQGDLKPIAACHCSQCRRQTGLYLVSTNVALDRLTLQGEEWLQWYRASDTASRGFCSTCGSVLFWKADDGTDIAVAAGAFDQPLGMQIREHMYCADKGDFYEVPEDGARRYTGDQSSG